MDGDDLELLISFVLRQKRFLRTLETSYTPRELDQGRRILKSAIKSVRRERARLGIKDFADEIASRAGRTRLADTLVRENTVLSKRQACLLLENFELFNHVLSAATATLAVTVKREEHAAFLATVPRYTDRYYIPTPRTYD